MSFFLYQKFNTNMARAIAVKKIFTIHLKTTIVQQILITFPLTRFLKER